MSSTDTQPSTVKAKLFAMSSEWLSQLKTLPTMAPRSHWIPYICLFLYPILVLQVKQGGSVMLGLLLFSGIYMLIKEKVKWNIKPILPLYYCFVFFWLVDFVTAGLAEREPLVGMLSSFTQIHFLLFPLFFVIFSNLRYGWRVFILGGVISLLVSVVAGLYQWYILDYGRIFGGINAILFSNIILVQMALVALFSIYFNKHWFWLVIILALVPFVLSLSRGAYLALPVLVLLLFSHIPKSFKYWFKSRILHFSLVLIVLCGYLFSDIVVNRVGWTISDLSHYMDGSDINTSTGRRLAMYKGGVEIALKHPWIGVGRENVNSELIKTSVMAEKNLSITSFSHLHNEYLTALAGSGVFGLFSLLLVLIVPYILIRGSTSHRVFCGQIGCLCALYAVYGLTNLAFDNGTLNGFFMITLAVIFSSINSVAAKFLSDSPRSV